MENIQVYTLTWVTIVQSPGGQEWEHQGITAHQGNGRSCSVFSLKRKWSYNLLYTSNLFVSEMVKHGLGQPWMHYEAESGFGPPACTSYCSDNWHLIPAASSLSTLSLPGTAQEREDVRWEPQLFWCFPRFLNKKFPLIQSCRQCKESGSKNSQGNFHWLFFTVPW